MKKFLVSLIVLALCIFTIACGNTTDPGTCDPDEECCNGVGKCGDEDEDIIPDTDKDGTVPDDGDTVDDDDDTVDDGDTVSDTDCDENSVICKIQTGVIAEGTEVTVNECVVTAVYYAQDESFNNTAIKGIYVSDIIPEAKPYTGIYVFIKATAAVDEYKIGDKLEVKGVYKEYYENSQIEMTEIKKLGTAEVPAPAVIADPAAIATPFEVTGQDDNGYDVYDPTANHGPDAEKYEGVLVKVTDVEITNKYIGHGNFELDNSLVVTKTLYYYEGDRSKGVVFESVQGILVYEYNAFRLAPRAADDFVEREQPPIKDDDDDVTDDSDTEKPDVDSEPATIKEVQSGKKAKDTFVTIEKAIISSPVFKETKDGSDMYSFYVSDGKTGDYSGLYIYRVSAAAVPVKGDNVTVEGQVTSFKPKNTEDQVYEHEQWEIRTKKNVGSVTKADGTGTVPAVVEKAVADLKDADKGTYVKITDELTVKSVDSKGKVVFTNGFVAEGFGDVKLNLSEGNKVKLSGIYDVVYGELGLFVIDANDVKK